VNARFSQEGEGAGASAGSSPCSITLKSCKSLRNLLNTSSGSGSCSMTALSFSTFSVMHLSLFCMRSTLSAPSSMVLCSWGSGFFFIHEPNLSRHEPSACWFAASCASFMAMSTCRFSMASTRRRLDARIWSMKLRAMFSRFM